jgi:predicted nucleic acid-binding protein
VVLLSPVTAACQPVLCKVTGLFISAGKRRDTLHTSLEQRILPLFIGRILPFDTAASEAYAALRTRARAQGKAIAPADGYIAATAATHGLIVATRDIGPFEASGLTVINPWNTQH